MRHITTVYNQDPERTQFVEWREIWCFDDEKLGTVTVAETHGWWDDEKKETSQKKTETLAQCETEAQAIKTMDRRICWLRDKGWIYKCTDKFLSRL